MPVTLEPDVREHAGPAAVPVEEGVNPDRPVVEPHSLLQESFPPCFPEDEVVEKSLKLHLDLVPITAEVEVLLTELTSPHPDVAEHLLVKPLCPGESERC